jgi:hypothetical protein
MDPKKGKVFVKILFFFVFVFIIGLYKKLTNKLIEKNQETYVYKRDLERQDNGTSSNESDLTFCKNPTINEFPEDFSPFRNSTSYFRELFKEF